jgi:hypothetical protein
LTMTVSANDIKFRKSAIQTDTDANGGRRGMVEVVSGARHALFPRVTKSQRESGLIRYRKQFFCNENPDDEAAYGVLVYLMRPSNAGDRFYLAKGTQRDVQAQFKRKTDINTYAATRYARTWVGCGVLETALTGGENQIQLAMESNDFQFPNDGYLYLANNTMKNQTVDADVKVGDSVYFSAGSWSRVAHTNNINYPYGWSAGAGEVLTIQETTSEEFLRIAKNETLDEIIGAGDGSNVSPALSTLANITNGICRQAGLLPVVKATCGGVERTVTVGGDGLCTGYCSGGQLNIATGAWTTPITWTTAPDNLTDITITYCRAAFSYSGNVATVELSDQVANAYGSGAALGAGCVHQEEVKCSFDSWSKSTAAGTYDEVTYPPVLFNDGTVEDDWTLTFTSGSNFAVSGAYYGSVGTGSVSSDFNPINPDTGQPYFTIRASGWGGTWQSGESVSFTTHPAALPILLEEEVPAGTEQEPNNMVPIGSYAE